MGGRVGVVGSIGGCDISPQDLGAHLWVDTDDLLRQTPPTPHKPGLLGKKRWGIEGIRMVTSDRFGKGRGE